MAKTIKELAARMEQQQEEVASLRSRVSALVDELHATRQELDSFKAKVASDMRLVSKSDKPDPGFWR
jgi:predicted RNase H-like nuclease (RuvC/YqgF family)